MLAFLRSPHRLAGVLSLIAAFLVSAIWYVTLFVATPGDTSPAEAAANSLAYLLSAENPSRGWFVWLAVAPFVSTALGFGYLFGLSRSAAPATALFVVTVALAVTGFYFVTWSLALFVALPCYWGFLCVRSAV